MIPPPPTSEKIQSFSTNHLTSRENKFKFKFSMITNRAVNEFRCKRCIGRWKTVLTNPKTCRWCHTTYWDKDRVRRAGAGRPNGSKTGGSAMVAELGGSERPKNPVATNRTGKIGGVIADRGDVDEGFDFNT